VNSRLEITSSSKSFLQAKIGFLELFPLQMVPVLTTSICQMNAEYDAISTISGNIQVKEPTSDCRKFPNYSSPVVSESVVPEVTNIPPTPPTQPTAAPTRIRCSTRSIQPPNYFQYGHNFELSQ